MNERGIELAYLISVPGWYGRTTYCIPLNSRTYGSLFSHHRYKRGSCRVAGTHFPAPFHTLPACPSLCVCVRSHDILTTSCDTNTTRDRMVKTGIPFMLEDRSGSLSGSEFVDLYDRMSLRLRCTRRDPDGASQYGVYNDFSPRYDIPVVTLEYGAAGALGTITTIGPGGSSRTQTMTAFLVEIGGYATAPHCSLRSLYTHALMQCICIYKRQPAPPEIYGF